MNTMEYDQHKNVASIQPGATWGSVFTALAPHDVVAVGGRATPVGVGGFTTGGGYSFHTVSTNKIPEVSYFPNGTQYRTLIRVLGSPRLCMRQHQGV